MPSLSTHSVESFKRLLGIMLTAATGQVEAKSTQARFGSVDGVSCHNGRSTG